MKNRDEADAMITARVVSFSFPAESGVLRFMVHQLRFLGV